MKWMGGHVVLRRPRFVGIVDVVTDRHGYVAVGPASLVHRYGRDLLIREASESCKSSSDGKGDPHPGRFLSRRY